MYIPWYYTKLYNVMRKLCIVIQCRILKESGCVCKMADRVLADRSVWIASTCCLESFLTSLTAFLRYGSWSYVRSSSISFLHLPLSLSFSSFFLALSLILNLQKKVETDDSSTCLWQSSWTLCQALRLACT